MAGGSLPARPKSVIGRRGGGERLGCTTGCGQPSCSIGAVSWPDLPGMFPRPSRLERLTKHATALRKSGAPIVLAGDYNVAPTDLDIYPTPSWDDDALIHPESRAAYRRLVGRIWTDALRHLHPKERAYTFWHYKRMRWQRDAGLRLDQLLLSRNLADRLEEAGVDRDVRSREGASDHAPVWVRLRDA